MRFGGRLQLQGDPGPGLAVDVRIDDGTLVVTNGTEVLGSWALHKAKAARVGSDRFVLRLGGEQLVFVAEDPVGFSYVAVPMFGALPPVRSGMLGRLKGRRVDPAAVGRPAAARSTTRRSTAGGEAAAPSTTGRASPARATPGAARQRTDARPALTVVPAAAKPPTAQTPAAQGVVRLDNRSSPVLPEATRPAFAGCRAARQDGQPCRATMVGATGYCYAHDPALAEQRSAARRSPGRVSTSSRELGELYARLERAAQEVQQGTMDPATAMALASLTRAMCAALDLGAPRHRLEDLAEQLGGKALAKKAVASWQG